jgi:hypothetical protein
LKQEQKYYVLLGDVIGSSQKSKVQYVLHATVEQINKEKDQSWKTPFEITRGDEVAVVLGADCQWFQIMRRFIDLTYPLDKVSSIKIRWALTFDIIKEGLDSESSAEALGPAFNKADRLMWELKKNSMYFQIDIGDNDKNKQLNGIINLILWRFYNITPIQYNIYRIHRQYRNQIMTAKKVNKAQQQIQKALKVINWKIMDQLEDTIDSIIQIIIKKIV